MASRQSTKSRLSRAASRLFQNPTAGRGIRWGNQVGAATEELESRRLTAYDFTYAGHIGPGDFRAPLRACNGRH